MLHSRLHSFAISTLPLSAFLTLSGSHSPAYSPVFTTAQTANKYQALSDKTCEKMRQQMAESLKVAVTRKTVPFEDTISKEKGQACQLTAKGSGRNFKTIAEIDSSIKAILTKDGWTTTTEYAADGPENKARGFRKDKDLAILTIESTLAKSVQCSNNVPISTCYERAKPEQVIYHIRLQAARHS